MKYAYWKPRSDLRNLTQHFKGIKKIPNLFKFLSSFLSLLHCLFHFLSICLEALFAMNAEWTDPVSTLEHKKRKINHKLSNKLYSFENPKNPFPLYYIYLYEIFDLNCPSNLY